MGNQMLGSLSSSGNYGSGNSGASGMNHGSNQMLGSMSSGGYASGSAHRNMHQSTGTVSQGSMNMRISSLSSGSQSIPEIGYLEEEISEADNSNTVFIQNHGSAGSFAMQSHGSSGSFGIQNHGSSGMQNHGSSGMQNQGRSGSYGIQSHGSSGSVGIQTHGSSGSGISGMNHQSVDYY